MYNNYMSKEIKDDSVKIKRLTSKRGSCQNSKESRYKSVSKLDLTPSEIIVHDREKLVKFI
jgi:hypothetical protein